MGEGTEGGTETGSVILPERLANWRFQRWIVMPAMIVAQLLIGGVGRQVAPEIAKSFAYAVPLLAGVILLEAILALGVAWKNESDLLRWEREWKAAQAGASPGETARTFPNASGSASQDRPLGIVRLFAVLFAISTVVAEGLLLF
jgi:hypothetical protein